MTSYTKQKMGLIAACIFVVYTVVVTPALVISRKSEIIEFFVHEILSARISAVAGQGFSTNCLKTTVVSL